MLTEEYESWRHEATVLLLSQRLPKFQTPPKHLTVHLAFFMATRRSDWDNYIKASCDALARATTVDDNRIYTGHVFKFIDRKAPHMEGVLVVDEEGPDLRSWRKFFTET